MTVEPEITTVNMVYQGVRTANGDRLYDRYVDSADHDKDYGFVHRKDLGHLIGSTYTVEVVDGNKYRISSAKRVSHALTHLDAAQWRLKDQAARQEIDALRAARRMAKLAKERNADLGDLTLDQLRQVYLRAYDRDALATVVLRYLRTGQS